MKFASPKKLTIIGGGIIGAFEAYYAFLDAKNINSQLRVTIYEKNLNSSDTTTSHIVPSLTPNEILAVLPTGNELVENFKKPFTEPNGLRIEDVANVNSSKFTHHFIKRAKEYSADLAGHNERVKILLKMGEMGMKLWQDLYLNADVHLKKILVESNFNPCFEQINEKKSLHHGYRIDLILNDDNASKKTSQIIADYQILGYKNCKILTPSETVEIDSFLKDFCINNSKENNESEWQDNVLALWRPAGCIDTHLFLPKFFYYLKKLMGNYMNKDGKIKNCFQIKFDRKVTAVTYKNNNNKIINGLTIISSSRLKKEKTIHSKSDFVFCPGEDIGTLGKMGFSEPASGGFAGASLVMNIPLSPEQIISFKKLNNYMEIHQKGLVFAWQAKFNNAGIFIGVAGGKAYYSDQKPSKNQTFALTTNIIQLNLINSITPQLVTIALGRESLNEYLNIDDLNQLEQAGILKRWVGIRAVAYDGFPTLGAMYCDSKKIDNARCTTHLGSGGAAFALASVKASRSSINQKGNFNDLISKILNFGNSKR